MTATAASSRPRRPVVLPVVVWVLHVALPLLALWLLIAQPRFDVRWENHPAHFWIVAAASGVNVLLAARINAQARRRSDARLFLVSMAFLAAAGFLGLHALATPGVILAASNAGFAIATTVGLALAAALAAFSSVDLSERAAARLIELRWTLRGILIALLIGWGVVSLGGFRLLAPEIPPTEAHGPLLAAAIVGSVLYGMAALRYFSIHRRRPAALLVSIITAFVLLAQAMVAIAYARNWQASWWEWHVLMVLAFGFIAYSAHVQYGREGSRSGLFNSVALQATLDDVRAEHSRALEALVDAIEISGSDRSIERVAAEIGSRFGLTERQIEVLTRSAHALAAERDQIRKLDALVAIGHQASVIRPEAELIEDSLNELRAVFGRGIGMALLKDDRLVSLGGSDGAPSVEPLRRLALQRLEPVESADARMFVVPLVVKGRGAGVLEIERPTAGIAPRDRALVRSLASQISIALENARLYRQIEGLFRSYISPDVATALLADPDQAALGGAIREVTVLMADLERFTDFAERSSPSDVVAMLNDYFGAAVPCVLEQGGTVVQFVGDAMMALFNAPAHQDDHAARATRAGLALHDVIETVAKPGWPRFRVGINTGDALVGNIGSEQMRGFTAIGDTTNTAARLQAAGQAGQVVVGPRTYDAIRERARTQSLGSLTVKGKTQTVDAHLVIGMDGR